MKARASSASLAWELEPEQAWTRECSTGRPATAVPPQSIATPVVETVAPPPERSRRTAASGVASSFGVDGDVRPQRKERKSHMIHRRVNGGVEGFEGGIDGCDFGVIVAAVAASSICCCNFD